ncbi:VanZ family protein [Roseateles sp. BYS180W]|uniref:VanZ family protein n=2 Tax=Roseateles rivi TaxID=3299028 RepID=A0ABW7FSG4_9BURK
MLRHIKSPTLRFALQLCFVLMVLGIATLAFMPHPPREVDTGWDKANHILAFLALAAAGRLAWRQRALPLVVLLLAYGVLIELVQARIPGRSADPQDVVADSVGIALGLLLAAAATAVLRRWRQAQG